MESYEPMALRYRPQTIDQLIGQPTVAKSLRGMVSSQRITRTLLIHGPFGSGKTTTARLIARYVNCEAREPSGDPCGVCASCTTMADGNHPDVVELNAADARGIDTIREIIEHANFSPRHVYRCYILDEVHQLTPQAVQAMLKILEEPPSKTIFMLVTTEPGRLPFTIRSRCVQLKLMPVEPEVTAKHLGNICTAEGIEGVDSEILLEIARAVNGHPRDALSALEQVIHHLDTLADKSQIKAMLPQVIEEVVGIPPEVQVMKYLISILRGREGLALRMIRGIKNPDAFLHQSIKLIQQVLFDSVSTTLSDQYYRKFFDELDKKEVIASISVLAKLLELHMSSYEKAKTYVLEAEDLLILTAVKSTEIVKAHSSEL